MTEKQEPKAGSGSRGSYAGGLARRERILDVTNQMLAEVGYHGLSMRDIARRVGISHPGVIYHFPTKEALLMAVIQRYEEMVEFDISKMSTMQAEQLLQKFMQLCQLFQDNPVLAEMECMLAVEASSAIHPAHDHFAGRNHRLVMIMHAALQNLMDRGLLIRIVDVSELAYSLVALGTGLHIMWLYNHELFNPSVLLMQALIRYIDLSKPESIKLILTVGLSSPTLIRFLECLRSKTVIEMIQDGEFVLDEFFLKLYGMDVLPVSMVKRVVDSGLLTADDIAYCTKHHTASLELLGKLVKAEVIDKEDLEIVRESGMVSNDAIAALIVVAADKAKNK